MTPSDDENDSRHYSTSMLYRRVNDEILKLHERFDNINDAGQLVIVCECSDARCAEPIEITLDEYHELRSRLNHFAVKPEHRSRPGEVVDAENNRYWTVTPPLEINLRHQIV